MAICGHCGASVKGKVDHLRAKHGGLYYEDGPDGKFYDYKMLKDIHPGLVIPRQHWDAEYAARETDSE